MKKLLLATLAALTVLSTGPEAFAANPPAYGCRLVNVSEESITGRTFEGTLATYAVAGDPAGNITVRCDVVVNGVPMPGAAATASGAGVALTAVAASYDAQVTDSVRLCMEITWDTGNLVECQETLWFQVPAQEVVDLSHFVGDQSDPACQPDVSDCSNGTCYVNAGTCAGGFCVVNTGWCGEGCWAVVNTGTCGRPPQVDPAGVGRPI